MFLIVAVAAVMAADSPTTVDLRVSEGTTVTTFATNDPLRIDIGVYGNHEDLAPQTLDIHRSWLQQVRAASVGEETWFVSWYMVTPHSITAQVEGGRLRVDIGNGRLAASGEVLDLDLLIANPGPRYVDVTGLGVPSLLGGDGRWPLPPLVAFTEQVAGFPTEVTNASWEEVDRLKSERAKATDDAARAKIDASLGAQHLALHWPREARFYARRAGRIAEGTAELDWMVVKASLEAKDLPSVQRACADLLQHNAPAALVARCLGAVALETGSPPPAEVARALLAADDTPRGHALAATLFLADRMPEVAVEIMGPVGPDTDPWGALAVGDAALARGDADVARKGWGRAGDLLSPDAIRVRRLAADRLDNPAVVWSRELPNLERILDGDDPAGADAGRLAAGIALALGDTPEAGRLLHNVVARFPRRATRSEIPAELARICAIRSHDLAVPYRAVDEVAWHTTCWHPRVDEVIADPTPLAELRDALRVLGAYAEALDVDLRIAAIETRERGETRESLRSLATSYAQTGRVAEAIATLAYARGTLGVDDGDHEPDRIAALAYERAHQWDLARGAWQQLAKDEATAIEAKGEIARLDANNGRCDAAEPVLVSAIANNVADATDRLALAACRSVTSGDVDLVLGPLVDDPEATDEAVWLTAVAHAGRSPGPPLPPGTSPGNRLENRLVLEESHHAAFRAAHAGLFFVPPP